MYSYHLFQYFQKLLKNVKVDLFSLLSASQPSPLSLTLNEFAARMLAVGPHQFSMGGHGMSCSSSLMPSPPQYPFNYASNDSPHSIIGSLSDCMKTPLMTPPPSNSQHTMGYAAPQSPFSIGGPYRSPMESPSQHQHHNIMSPGSHQQHSPIGFPLAFGNITEDPQQEEPYDFSIRNNQNTSHDDLDSWQE